MALTDLFLDSSFFKALIDNRDEFHSMTKPTIDAIEKGIYKPVTTNYILDETLTLIRVKSGLDKTLQFGKFLRENRLNMRVVRVHATDDAAAWEWFVKDWSHLSFTDCVSFAVMKRLEITHVATFDQHFKRAGFTIVEPQTT